ncbi:unnamed protein product [marine sediment metagenome]|uniref:Uncharacterized protein n=1 Tax=marine sediment metagenome TaxID=412755 RepID=X1V7J6_9ZZZZ
MAENKVKKNDRLIVSNKKISAGVLDEGNAFTLGIEIPGRGKVNIKISFEKGSSYLSPKKMLHYASLIQGKK